MSNGLRFAICCLPAALIRQAGDYRADATTLEGV